MTALTLGLIISLHGFAAQLVFPGGALQGVTQGAASASMTFTTDSARVTELRGYGGAMFVRSAPFGLVSSEVVNGDSTLTEPYGDVPGADGSLVAPRDDSIPEDEEQLCAFCPSS